MKKTTLTKSPWIAALVACLGACAADTPEATSDVNSYLQSLPAWPEPSPDAEAPLGDAVPEEPQVVEGEVYSCTTTPYSITQTPDDLVLFNPDADIIWPSVLIQGRSYQDGIGSFVELPIRERAPVAVSVDLLFGDNTRLVDNPSLASIQEAVGGIIHSAHEAGIVPSSSINYSRTVSHSAEQAALALGLSARFLTVEARAKLAASTEANKTTVTASFVQRAFTVSVAAPQTPGELFSSDFTMDDLDEQIALGRVGPDNLPVYLANITYGRLLLFSFTASASKEEIIGTLNVVADGAIAGGSASLSARQQAILESSEISVFTLGGDDDAALALIRSGQLADYFADDVAITSFTPISYTLRNVGDNSIAKVSETTTYNVKECVATTPVDVPRDGLVVELSLDADSWISSTPPVFSNSAEDGVADGVIHKGCRLLEAADRFGYAAHAYAFNGNCDAAAPSLVYFDAPGYKDSFSYSLWVKSNGHNGWLLGTAGGPALMLPTDGGVSFEIPGGPTLRDVAALAPDAWTHLAVTVAYENGTTTVALYRDGQLVDSATVAGTLGLASGDTTLLGNANGGPGIPYPGRLHDFNGTFDAVRIYDRALSADEIVELRVEGAASQG